MLTMVIIAPITQQILGIMYLTQGTFASPT